MAFRLSGGLDPAILRVLAVRMAIQHHPNAVETLRTAAFTDNFVIAVETLGSDYEWRKRTLQRNVGELVVNMHLSLGDSDTQTQVVAESYTKVMEGHAYAYCLQWGPAFIVIFRHHTTVIVP